jgi:hypothetical protein
VADRTADRITGWITVPFTGDDSGEAPLTWGQQHIWDWMCRNDEPLSMSAVRPLDTGAEIDEFVDELRFFMSRFQAMRTRLRPDPSGWPWQVVARSGEVALEIVDADDGEDPAAVADAVSARHRGSHFDYAHEWPIRMALVRQAGVLTHLVTTLCHVVVDAAAAMVMFTDLLARDPATGTATEPVAMGPLELAAWQQSPAGRRQSDLAMLYWEKQLRTMPAAASGPQVGLPVWPSGPVVDTDIDPDRARYWQFDYTSPAMYQALRCLADRLASDTAPVLLAGYATALARVTGRDAVAVAALVSNRFRRGLDTMVSLVNQVSLCVLDLAGKTFDETVVHARRRTMNAYKNGYYDQFQRDALIARIARERGVPIDLECWVNDRRMSTTIDGDAPPVTEAQVRSAIARRTLDRKPLALFIKKLMVTINDADDAVSFTLQADTEYISLVDLEALVREIEAVIVDAAFQPSMPALARRV